MWLCFKMNSDTLLSPSKTNGHSKNLENGFPLMPTSKENHCGPSSDVRYTSVPTNPTTARGTPSSYCYIKETELNINNNTKNRKSLESISFITQKSENRVNNDLSSLQKDSRTKCEKCALYSSIFGIIFVLSAIIW